MTTVLLAVTVLAGASVQRMSGIGFALVSAPMLAMLLGPAEGVLLANCSAGVISLVGLLSGWREVRLRTMVPLVLAAGCTVPAGAWLARALPTPMLLGVMGALVTVAVLLVLGGTRVAALRGTGGAVAAGAVSGFMNSSAGVGGPALSLYAVNSGWTAREFVPNAQFYGLLVNVFSVTAKGLPHLSTPAWLLAGAAIAGGTVAGQLLAARVSDQRARRIVLLLALLGGLSTLGKGIAAGF